MRRRPWNPLAVPKKTETKDFHYSVWVTQEQRAEVDKASEAEGEERPSTWIRKLMLKAAREVNGTKKGAK